MPTDSLSILSARRVARDLQAKRDDKLRRLHERIVILLSSPDAAAEIRRQAAERIAKWEAAGLCSHFFVDQWRRILSGGAQAIQRDVLSPSAPNAKCLMQNTPFSFLLRDLS